MSVRHAVVAVVVLTASAFAILPAPAHAAVINIFNTGVDSNGNLLPDGAVDPHYTVQIETYDQNAPPTATGPQPFITDYNGATYVGGNAYRPDPAAGGFNGYGVDTAQSGFIAWSPNNIGGNVAYTYRTAFDLTGYNPATAYLLLNVVSDDDFALALNGVVVPGSYIFRAGGLREITSGFIDGINTLDILNYNEGGPGGISVVFETATVDVPEPASIVLLAGGLLAVGLLGSRVRPALRD